MSSLEMRRPRVLIVDDDTVNVRLLGSVLEDMCERIFAPNGKRALELLALGGVDLVLLDVTMPEMDGLEVCRRLKADDRTRAVPVIFVTGRDEVDDQTSGFDAGGVDYITKPFNPPVVRARVRTHLELKAARDTLERMASVDGLTGLANRRSLDEGLQAEWRRASRSSIPFTVALLDVDHFKGFNDTYGHAAGDECLRSVARAIAAECRRPADIAARYGGEEFALVLPDTDAAAACELLQRVLARVAALRIPHSASSCSREVTISGGGITTAPSAAATATDALHAADRLLYDAKREGRNRAIHIDLVTGARRALTPDGANA